MSDRWGILVAKGLLLRLMRLLKVPERAGSCVAWLPHPCTNTTGVQRPRPSGRGVMVLPSGLRSPPGPLNVGARAAVVLPRPRALEEHFHCWGFPGAAGAVSGATADAAWAAGAGGVSDALSV